MLGAPAVTHAAGRTRRLALLLMAPWVLGAGGGLWVTAFGSGQPLLAWKGLALGAAVALAGLALVGFWRGQRPCRLAWDGAQWRLIQPGATPSEIALRRVQVRLDVQHALLLRLDRDGPGAGRWLWTQAGRDQANWHLLRCALYGGDFTADRQGDSTGGAPA